MRMSGSLVRWAVFPVVLISATAVTLLPSPMPVLLSIGVALVLVMLVIPMNALLALWGATLPIWSVAGVDPIVFDGVRLLGAIVIAVRNPAQEDPLWGRAVSRWAVPVIVVALATGSMGFVRSDASAVSVGFTMLFAAVLSALAVSRLRTVTPLLLGFALGVALSGFVILLAAVGIPTISPLEDLGVARVTGLAPSATRVATELAVAVVVFGSYVQRHRIILPMAGALLCFVALLISGGRVGVVGLMLAIVVALFKRWIPPAFVLAALLLLLTIFSQMPQYGVELHTVNRLTSFSDQAGGSDFSSGRVDLFVASLDQTLRHPLVGSGLDVFVERYGHSPHVTPLLFSVAGGLVVGVIVLILGLRMLWILRRRVISPGPEIKAASLGIVVLFSTILLQPTGPFVGVESITMLFVFAALVQCESGLAGRGGENHVLSRRPRDAVRLISTTTTTSRR